MSILPSIGSYANQMERATFSLPKWILSITTVLLGMIALVYFRSPNRETVGLFLAIFAIWMALMGGIESAVATRANRILGLGASSKRTLNWMVATGFTLAISLIARSPLPVALVLVLALLVIQIEYALSAWSIDRRQSLLMIPLILSTIAMESILARAIGASL